MTGSTLTPSTEREAAFVQTKQILSMPNSPISGSADILLTFLEGGRGNLPLRDFINDWLSNQNRIMSFRGGYGIIPIHPTYDQLTTLYSLKEKLAYIVSLSFPEGSTSSIDRDNLIDRINNTLYELENDVISKFDMSEGAIIRNALLSRMQLKLSMEQQAILNDVANKVKNLCNNSSAKYNMHFTQETDAQKILKIREAIQFLTENGETIPADISTSFKSLNDKLNTDTNILGTKFDHVQHCTNVIHEVARHGYADFWLGGNTSMITKGQEEKLLCVIKAAGKKPTDFLFKETDGKYNFESLQFNLTDFKNSLNKEDLDNFLDQNHLTEDEFDKYFLVYFALENLKNAKGELDKQKYNSLGGVNIKPFEQDINKWRGIMRDRIMNIQTINPTLNPTLPASYTDSDMQFLNSYYEKFRSLFYVDQDGQPGAMMERLIAVLRYRCPNTIAAQNINMNDLAMAVSGRNQVHNDMIYNDRNPFRDEEGGGQRVLKAIGRTEKYRNRIKTALSPTLNTFLRGTEEAIKLALRGVAGAGKIVTQGISDVTGWANNIVEKKAEGGFFKKLLVRTVKIPLYVLYPVTKVAEKVSTGTNKFIGKTEEIVKKGYDNTITFIRNTADDQQINHMFQGITYAADGVTSLLGRGTSFLGNLGYDQLNTRQKREVIAGLYEAAGSERQLQRWMEAGDIAQMLNFKEDGFSVVDESGSVESVENRNPALEIINGATPGTIGNIIINNSLALGLNLTDYNSLVNNEPIHTALIGKNFSIASQIKTTFDTAVAVQKAAEKVALDAINVADTTNILPTITAHISTLGLNIANYNLIINKLPVFNALIGKNFVETKIIKTTFENEIIEQKIKEDAVKGNINAATLTNIGTIIASNMGDLGLNLIDYNSLANNEPIHTALIGKSFPSASEIKTAFDIAVTNQINKEILLKQNINAATLTNIGTIIASNMGDLGLTLTDYNLLVNKSSIYNALIGKGFTDVNIIKSTFENEVTAQKTKEDGICTSINGATVVTISNVINTNIPLLGIDLKNYNLLTDKTPVQNAFIAVLTSGGFLNTLAIKTAFENEVKTQITKETIDIINSTSDVVVIGTTITSRAKEIGLNLTDYNSLTNKLPVHNALIGKSFVDIVAMRTDFDNAVLTQKTLEDGILGVFQSVTNPTDIKLLIAIHGSDLGWDIAKYNLLDPMRKNLLHNELYNYRGSFFEITQITTVFNNSIA